MNKPNYMPIQYRDVNKNDVIKFENGREATVLRVTTTNGKTTLEMQYTDMYGGSGKTSTYSTALVLIRTR